MKKKFLGLTVVGLALIFGITTGTFALGEKVDSGVEPPADRYTTNAGKAEKYEDLKEVPGDPNVPVILKDKDGNIIKKVPLSEFVKNQHQIMKETYPHNTSQE
ncbi:hypothetical protein [Melghirimyces algeriensis]|uniref:Uncharacterized protein n=1 Tax=Melghirimyces algeriensis TaxID=910412 RepID=A0A521D6M1_9BACL|nr:hypothetical protein [Melghirimyces algeriensis]SMO67282.1 hypothetical protein SAMN06264849_105164 [Melghirimyces algeriensis]